MSTTTGKINETATTTGAVHVLGIRHHGPGSSRSLRKALTTLRPSLILIEGPPDADELIPLAGHEAMTPPVALLIYRPESPAQSAYYPFAEFSPEWQAIKYAQENHVPVRFMDLPIRHQLADDPLKPDDPTIVPESPAASPPLEQAPDPSDNAEAEDKADDNDADLLERLKRQQIDPLGMLAKAAGFEDGERWWEFVVEGRREGEDIFEAILEAMGAVRERVESELESETEDDPREARREAYMRQTIRAAIAEGHASIAVVCGAWHAPALAVDAWPPARLDAARLAGLPKTKVAATWVPWTYGRLSRESGYGAGIESPGWYDHLWTAKDHVVERWLTRVARLLRDERLDASSASVIEAVRLADALATMRGRPLADLADLDEATRAVLCSGEELPMALIRERLVVGERIGKVPDETPTVPLQQDLNKLQKRLRLAPDPTRATKALDLREPTDLQRSRLLHRLVLLGIPWGKLTQATTKGTFKEAWELCWQPEWSVAVIEASVWGTTVEDASNAFAAHRAETLNELPELTLMLQQAMLADLPKAVAAIMTRVESLAAVSADVSQLLDALPPLANLTRYGNVRQTDSTMVAHAASGMVARIAIGLPVACSSLDDSAASAMFESLLKGASAIDLLANPDDSALWHESLKKLADSETTHALVVGRAVRILLDASVFNLDDTAKAMNLALSTAAEPARVAAWVEGFLRDSGEVLQHDDVLFGLFHHWLASISHEAFDNLLPMLRRTFSTLDSPLRRLLGEKAKRFVVSSKGPGSPMPASVMEIADLDLDQERAATVLPLLARLLGLNGGPR